MRHWRFEHVRDSALSLLGARALSFIAEIGTHASLCYSIHAPPLQEIVKIFFWECYFLHCYIWVRSADGQCRICRWTGVCACQRREHARTRERDISRNQKKISVVPLSSFPFFLNTLLRKERLLEARTSMAARKSMRHVYTLLRWTTKRVQKIRSREAGRKKYQAVFSWT